MSLGFLLAGCGESAVPVARPVAPVVKVEAKPVSDDVVRETLRKRLLALDYFAVRMWPADQPNASVHWLRSSAQKRNLELSRVIPEPVMVAESVGARRVTVRAEGEWKSIVSWLQAIEDEPRKLMVRELSLHQLRGRAVADVKLTVLFDLPKGLNALAKLDVPTLAGSELQDAVNLIDEDLREKSETLERLGAEVSWALPIALITRKLPGGSSPIRLTLSRGDLGQRAQRFDGEFTAQVRSGADIVPLVNKLNATDGFASASLIHVKNVGASFQRATVTFMYGALEEKTAEPAEQIPGAIKPVETGRRPLKPRIDPFRR